MLSAELFGRLDGIGRRLRRWGTMLTPASGLPQTAADPKATLDGSTGNGAALPTSRHQAARSRTITSARYSTDNIDLTCPDVHLFYY